jgi:hypothetical protein
LLQQQSPELPKFVLNQWYACILCTGFWTKNCIDTDNHVWILDYENSLGFNGRLYKTRQWYHRANIMLRLFFLCELLIGYTLRVFHGGQTWYPEYGAHTVTLLVSSLLKKRTTGWPFVVTCA